MQRGKKDDAKAELISFKDRWGIKTNAVDWLLTVPNIGVEFDLGNTISSDFRERHLQCTVQQNQRRKKQQADFFFPQH